MFGKFVALLLLIVIIIALAFVAIADVTIPQKDKIVSIKTEQPVNQEAAPPESSN